MKFLLKLFVVNSFAYLKGFRKEARMRSIKDLSIRQKLQMIVMATSTAALLVASMVFALFDRSIFLRAKTQDLSVTATMVGSNSTAALSFGDTKSGGGEL